RRDHQLPLASDSHGGKTLVPALDDLSGTQDKFNRLTSRDGAIKYRTIRELTGIMYLDPLSSHRLGALPHLLIKILQPRRRRDIITGLGLAGGAFRSLGCSRPQGKNAG